jgi:organic radical activating enzyme
MSAIPNTGLWSVDITPAEKVAWISQNQHICLNPYTTLHNQINKNAKIQSTCCCNLIPSEINDHNFTDLKLTIEQGIKNSRCQVCYNSEKQIGSSERTISLLGQQPEKINYFLDTGVVDQFEFRIKFSNLCNLACKTCQPEFSSKYAQVYSLPVLKELQEDIGANEIFWKELTNQIVSKCQEISQVSIALFGGETLIQPGAIRLINWLIDNKLSDKITLRLTTNFTNLKENIIKHFDKFKLVSICASIDSVNENYGYVRYPEKFSTITDNLNLIIENKKNTKIKFFITPVWSLHNIFYINDYVEWWYHWFTQNNINDISIDNVSMSEPHIMTVQNLPVEYRQHLLSIVSQALTHKLFENPRHTGLKEYLLGLIVFLSSNNIVYDKFTNFLQQTAQDDRYTNMSMSVGNARLYNILNSDDVNCYKNHLVD